MTQPIDLILRGLRKISGTALTGVFLLTALTGCDGDPAAGLPAAETGCPAAAAELRVGDGFQQIVCGCQEGSAILLAGTPLTCTVPAGTTVFFIFAGNRLSHQILSTGTPAFASSPVSNPGDATDKIGKSDTMIRAHGVRLDAPGSYTYQDAYFSDTLQGTIVAQ